ncbi:MAG: efflux RND transporter periplasmic adaptor subunit [Candidatus Solibacter usitatus]|nr:efflux RND transporter periplasmic adaptor subunit [Candidatus Solibacter usitatus]
MAGCSTRPQAAPGPVAAKTAPSASTAVHEVRATGTIRAVREFSVQVPQLSGQGGRLTIIRILASGTRVEPGEVLAEFDRTQQFDNARDAQAKLDDLNHQIDQRKAENRANAESRASEYQTAEADLAKARLQLRRDETISEIERAKNGEKARAALARLDSLKVSGGFRAQADAAALRILELKRDRQGVALKRADTNVGRLVVKAPHSGMVALEPVWRGDSRGPAQEGDQVYPGQSLLRLFDPTEMEVHASVGEPDGAVLRQNARAIVRLDAYPGLLFHARFLSASPVAASDLGSPIKRFAARFLIESTDARLLPDLSAAVLIRAGEEPAGEPGR